MRLAIESMLVGLLLGGCATSGVGTAELVEPSATHGGSPQRDLGPVTLHWQSDGMSAIEGWLTASLPDGTIYRGRYMQVTEQRAQTDYAPYWVGWDPWWPGWAPGWNMGPSWGYWGPTTSFITYYSGRVIANLEGPEGSRMRCRFALADPPRGMAGGGMGDCQMSNGDAIESASFPAE